MAEVVTPLVWLITGTSSGFGRELAIAALERGDWVIATSRARSFSRLEDLEQKGAKILELDVTAPLEQLNEITKRAVAFYGKIDVLVNNAGYLHIGTLEESTPQETYDQFNTIVFGALNICRAVLPFMRQRRTGTIAFIGSIGGWGGLANVGLYIAAKHALRGLSSTLHQEISPLGLRSICVDLGYFRTAFLKEGRCLQSATRLDDYRQIAEESREVLQAADGKQAGDPVKGARVLIDLVHADGMKGRPFPTNIQLGSDCYTGVKNIYEQALNNLDNWKDISCSTEFPKTLQ
ncbi:hypothetical protein AAF712_001795 [Marasmius tenuissimus]|uniref:Uncharacterized protein n=1 Tax=Marasmius tenuissimus TaxID=585030 RepID=A0ABR3AE37_9AGAR